MMWGPSVVGGWGIAVALALVAFIALIVGGIVLVIRPSKANPPAQRDQALDILDQRFARGEIDEEEYQKRRSLVIADR
jgi:putative membrane protein